MSRADDRIVSSETVRVQLAPTINFVFATCLLAIIGCGRAQKANPPTLAPPFSGKKLRIACTSPPARKLLDRHAAAWARLQHVVLEISDSPDANADLVVFPPHELGALVERDRLAELPHELTTTESWSNLLRLYRNKLMLWGARPFALPILGDATFVIYRADLFAAAGRKPPETVTQFMEIAQQFHKERGKPSLPAIPADDDGLDREFFAAAASFAVGPVSENQLRNRKADDRSTAGIFAFHRDVTTAHPRINDAGFAAALDWLSQLQPWRGTKKVAESLSSDEAVMGLATLADLAALKPLEHAGRFGVAAIPAGPQGERVPYAGPAGAMIAIHKSAAEPAAAMALALFLSDAKVSFEVVHDPTMGCAPYRAAHLSEHRDGWFNYGLDPTGTQNLIDALRQAVEPRIVNAPFRLRTPNEQEYRTLLLRQVRTALTNRGDTKKALDFAAAEWRDRDAQQSAEKLLNDYLRSLGLRP